MVLQSSGAISLSNIQTEFGGSNPIAISEYYGAASGIPSSGTISFNDFYGKSSGATQTTYADLKSMRSDFVSNNYKYNTSVSTIKSVIEGYGYDLVATPKYYNIAERLAGVTSITQLGKFSTSLFSSSTYLQNSSGFSNSSLNNRPFMAIALFDNNGLRGILCMIFRSNTNSSLKDFFYPKKNSNSGHNVYAFVLNANNTEIVNTNSNTRWNFSNNQRATSSGYYQSGRFSYDDGVWGVKFNSLVDGNTPGPRLSSSSSYGIENYNASDSQSYFYWGSSVSSTTHSAYVFVRRNAYT